MSGYTKNRAFDRIRQLSHAGLDVTSFFDEASAVLALAVPNGTDDLESPQWYTLDPESQLITSDYGGEGCDLDTNAVMRWEYLEDDFNKYDEVLRHPRGVQTLHEVTGGEPGRSRIYREYMAAAGLAQEMLVSLRARNGVSWGTVRLNRAPGQPEFDSGEIEFMARVAPDLADGARRGLLVGEATDPDLPDAPGLVVLDADGEIDSLGPGADRWIARLPGRPVGGPLPASVASVASAALDAVRTTGSGSEATVRVSSFDGRWITVHGTVIRVDGTLKAAIIIGPTHHDRITPLLMAIYGLTDREQEVTRLVLHGTSTAQPSLGTTSGVGVRVGRDGFRNPDTLPLPAEQGTGSGLRTW